MKPHPFPFVLPLAVLLIGGLSTAAISAAVIRTINAQDRERFETAADRLQDGIQGRLETYIAMLRAGAGLLGTSTAPTPDDFRAFVDRLELEIKYPGVQGVGYTERIPRARLQGVIARQRQLGNANFDIWPDDPRDEYHAIIYLEPMDRRNSAAMGYDMFTESNRRAAMEHARDSGEPAASGLVTLVQEIDDKKQPGFLIYVPVYDGGNVPDTTARRRELLRGFVYSPFRIEDLLAGILGRAARPTVGFELLSDGPGGEPAVYRIGEPARRQRFTTTRAIDVADRTWRVAVFSTRGLDETSSVGLVPYLTWGGVGVTLLLTALALMQARARAHAERSRMEAADASRQFRQLANSIPQLAWMARPDGWIYWYNDRWYEYTGTTPEQMAGWGWQKVHDPNELPRVLEEWTTSIAAGVPLEMEFPLRSATGEFRWFLTRVAPVRDDHGAIVQWFGTNTDVQYRRDADRALQQHADTLEIINRIGIQLTGELELERLVQAITDAATQVTRAQVGAFIYNRVAQQGDSYMVYTLPGAAREVSGPVSLPRNTPVASAIFRGEGPIRSDDITADERYGKSSPFHGMSLGHLPVRSYLAVPVKSRAGEVLGGLFFGHAESGIFTQQSQRIVGGIAAQAAIAIDNARLYARQQEVLDSERAARAEAERLSRMKDEFLTVLSHELRTPLNAIVGWAHMLAGQRLPPERQQHALESILRNAKAQSRLIEDLLDMSRIISGRLSLEMTELDLRDVIDAAVSSVQPLAAAKHVVLRVERHAEPLLVRGDSGRLQQTLWNLLTNAVKFTPSHGRVTITSREEDDGIELSIADTGIGIAPEFLPHVFDRFRQEDASFTRGHGGLGLGLSIVRSLVELHGGRVSVTSAGSEQGATFTITLPRAVQARAPGQQPAIHDALARATGVRALDNVLVLVVEDDSDARELTAEILKQHGARVTLAASAADALELLAARRIRPDLIISDLGMPEIDGYEFVQRLRTGDFGLDDVPKIALTAYASAGDQVRAAQAGFHVHLAKPFEPQQLVAACVSLLNPATR